jgi:adenylate cyclase
MMHDNALYCAYAIKKFFKKVLNPLLEKSFSINLKFRIGLNSGKAMIVLAGHPIARLHYDLIGDPINITKKIQSLSYADSILVGEEMNKEAHDFWKNKIEKINVQNFNWNINIYKLKILV